MKTELKCLCEGTVAEFWILNVFKDGIATPETHTSKSSYYLETVRRGYETGSRVFAPQQIEICV